MNKYIVGLVALIASSDALANCGQLPIAPALLKEPTLSVTQIEKLSPQMKLYLEQVQNYLVCFDEQASSLDRDSENFGVVFEEHVRSVEFAQEQQQLAIDRFNGHIENAVVDEPSEVD